MIAIILHCITGSVKRYGIPKVEIQHKSMNQHIYINNLIAYNKCVVLYKENIIKYSLLMNIE